MYQHPHGVFPAVACLLLIAGLCGDPAAQTAPPTAAGPSGYKLNWYAWADVAARPYMTRVYNLCDGDPGTGTYYEGGPEVGGALTFSFPAAVEVTAFRLMQSGATRLRLTGDTNGDGTFEKEIATVEAPKDNATAWLTIPVKMKLRGLEVVALAGQAGFRAAFPSFQEVEIYTARPINVPAQKYVTAVHALAPGKPVPMPELKVRQIENVIGIDFWMAGLKSDGSNLPADLNTFPPFRHMIEQARQLDATGVRLISEEWAGGNLYPWPTELGPHTQVNLLKALVDAVHKEGLRFYAKSHAWISPFQQADRMAPMPYRRWDYPYEQSDRRSGDPKYAGIYTVKYPCIISESDFHDKWLQLMSELGANGVDGVFFMPDEYYFKGHNLPKTDCPACQRAFKERFGYDTLPPKPEDTEQYRKWKLFEYQRIVGLFGDIAQGLKKRYPNMRVISNGNQAMVQLYNTRMEHGMALDMLGRDSSVDVGDVYGEVPLEIGGHVAYARRYKAAFGENRLMSVVQWMGITYNETPDPIKFYGYLLSMAMEGVRHFDHYRLNYMLDKREHWPTVIAGFQRMRLLEQWGIGQSRTPASVCVLLSRASEDWWEVKMEGLLGENAVDTSRSTVLYSQDATLGAIVKADTDTRTRELNYERFRGMTSDKCMEGLLINAGIPYDVRYSDRTDTLANLKNYKLIVLPFSYSMSQETFAALQAAVATGARVLILDQLAPTNEYGTAYPQPLLAALQGNPNVTFEKLSLAREGMKQSVRTRLTTLIQKLTGNTGLRFDARDTQVEYLIREVEDGSRILYLANWGYTPASPMVGLDLPAGQYNVTLCGGDGVVLRQGLLDGQPTAAAAAFGNFSVPLAPREVVLLHIEPVKAK